MVIGIWSLELVWKLGFGIWKFSYYLLLITCYLYNMFMFKFLNSNPITKFLVEVYHETLKVTWPTRQEVVKWLIVVIAVSLAMAAYVGVIDFFFTKILEYVVTR